MSEPTITKDCDDDPSPDYTFNGIGSAYITIGPLTLQVSVHDCSAEVKALPTGNEDYWGEDVPIWNYLSLPFDEFAELQEKD